MNANVIAFPGVPQPQVGFDRLELQRILDLYGRMVAAGLWRDYAMDFSRDAASFSAFRRAAVASDRQMSWEGVSDCLHEGAALLGLVQTLDLPARTPA